MTARLLRGSRPGGWVLALGAVALAVATWRAGEGREARPSDREVASAVEAVRTFVTLATHFQASGGDERFGERIPAEPAVLAELAAEVELGRQLGRVEEAKLVRAEVDEAKAVRPDVVEVRTREYWVMTSGVKGTERASVLGVRYVVRRTWDAWKVADWALDLRAERASEER